MSDAVIPLTSEEETRLDDLFARAYQLTNDERAELRQLIAREAAIIRARRLERQRAANL